MKRKVFIAAVFIFPLIAVGGLLYPWKKLERGAVDSTETNCIVPVNQEFVAARIADLFKTKKGALHEQFGKFVLVAATDPIFPDDFQLNAHSQEDTALRSYVALPPEKKKNDLYLYEPTGDFYWHSEYFYNDEPVKFRCNFLIHLEALAGDRTKVEVFEFLPRVWVGRRFDLGHSGAGFYHDIRPVAPTVSDRAELAELPFTFPGLTLAPGGATDGH